MMAKSGSQGQSIQPHRAARLYIIASDEGSVLVRRGFAVEEYDGDAPLPDTVDGRGYRRRLGRGYDEQVDARRRQAVNLPNL